MTMKTLNTVVSVFAAREFCMDSRQIKEDLAPTLSERMWFDTPEQARDLRSFLSESVKGSFAVAPMNLPVLQITYRDEVHLEVVGMSGHTSLKREGDHWYLSTEGLNTLLAAPGTKVSIDLATDWQ